jgi:uncharacterized damage-inducible protein DinB
MSTATMDRGAAAAKIDTYRDMYQKGHGMLMSTFAAVPDDKLNWKPADSARSALQIAAHIAASNRYFILAFQGQPPAADFPEIMKWIAKTAAPWTTKEKVMEELTGSNAELEAILTNLPPEILENERAQVGLWVSAFHCYQHCSQIDYLQTCWGDMDFHM